MFLDNNQMIGIKLDNISTGGLCGLITHFLQIDEKVEFILHHPFFEYPVKIEARVIWCRKETKEDLWRIGVDYSLNGNKRIDLSNYIKVYSPRRLG